MIHPSMRDIVKYRILTHLDPIAIHAFRMTCRQLWKWIAPNVDFVRSTQILLGMRESQPLIRFMELPDITPHWCATRGIIMTRIIPFSVDSGYTYNMPSLWCTLDEIISYIFACDNESCRVIRAIIGREFGWVCTGTHVVCIFDSN